MVETFGKCSQHVKQDGRLSQSQGERAVMIPDNRENPGMNTVRIMSFACEEGKSQLALCY